MLLCHWQACDLACGRSLGSGGDGITVTAATAAASEVAAAAISVTAAAAALATAIFTYSLVRYRSAFNALVSNARRPESHADLRDFLDE